MVERDYYKILEIPYNATVEEIEAAYKRLSKKYHPDFFHNNAKQEYANELMKRINEAYSILKDPPQKALFDEKIKKKRNNIIINIVILAVSLLFITILSFYSYYSYQKNTSLGIEYDLIPVIILIIIVLFSIAHITTWIIDAIKNKTKPW